MNINDGKRGFTLLEMLLVIAIIAILAGIVIVAINPAKQLADANNAQRQSDVLTILNAVHQYGIDHSGDLTDLGIDDVVNATCNDGHDVLSYGNLETKLTTDSIYLSAIPTDPLADVPETDAEYLIVQDTYTGRITVCAPNTQDDTGEASYDPDDDEVISVTR